MSKVLIYDTSCIAPAEAAGQGKVKMLPRLRKFPKLKMRLAGQVGGENKVGSRCRDAKRGRFATGPERGLLGITEEVTRELGGAISRHENTNDGHSSRSAFFIAPCRSSAGSPDDKGRRLRSAAGDQSCRIPQPWYKHPERHRS